jgi:hypothetical protein
MYDSRTDEFLEAEWTVVTTVKEWGSELLYSRHGVSVWDDGSVLEVLVVTVALQCECT